MPDPRQPLQELTYECGHLIADHADGGTWGPNTVCTEWIDEEHKREGFYGVCPCVRRGDVLGCWECGTSDMRGFHCYEHTPDV